MPNYFVIGHQSPDTDAVVSAIALSHYLKKKKIVAQPAILGKLNRETELVLKKFKQETPKILKRASSKDKFYLVDHGGLEQSITGLKEEQIVGIVDHHQLGGIKTNEPIFCRIEAVGSTSTIIAKMLDLKEKKIASLLLAGIISDTLNLTSKTTTQDDRIIAKKLAELTKIDRNQLAQELFEAKSDISGMSLSNIILNDFKEYKERGKKIGVGVFEAVTLTSFNQRQEEIFKVLSKIKKERNFDLLLFGSVDIIKKRTHLFILDQAEADIAKKAFKLSSANINSVVILEGVTSRKKEMIPAIFKSL